MLLCSYNFELLVCELNEHFDFTLVEVTLHYSELSEEIEEYTSHNVYF